MHKKQSNIQKQQKELFATLFCLASKIADVLNEKQYQFKFGVFPKWDEFTKKKTVKRQQARKKNKEGFEQLVEGKKEVYFVDAENASVSMVSFVFVYSGNLTEAT